MKKDDSVYLEHMLIYMTKLERFISGKEYSDFMKDEFIQNNVIRLLEVIGEASIKVSNEIKGKYKEVPWTKIKGMRNILVHDYGSIRIEVVWNTAELAIPILKEQIKKIIKDVNPQILINYQ
jgi:uncharacterized protein with HEPN domain